MLIFLTSSINQSITNLAITATRTLNFLLNATSNPPAIFTTHAMTNDWKLCLILSTQLKHALVTISGSSTKYGTRHGNSTVGRAVPCSFFLTKLSSPRSQVLDISQRPLFLFATFSCVGSWQHISCVFHMWCWDFRAMPSCSNKIARNYYYS